MSCPDCGSFHDSSSSDSSSDEYNYGNASSDSENDDPHFVPIIPPFFGPYVPTMNDMFPFFPFGNPLQWMTELQRFTSRISREQTIIKRAEERNRKRQLGSIAKTSFAKNLVNEKQCVICLEEFEEGTEVKRLSCKHHYHIVCIDKWLIQNGKCPLCNSKAVNSLEEVQRKFNEAKKLRENAQSRMRKRPKTNEIRAKRIEDIKKNPANEARRKLIAKRRTGPPSFLRRRSRVTLPNLSPLFGGLIPPPSFPTYDGAVDSDEEEEQIQRAIRESLKDAKDMDRDSKERNPGPVPSF